MQMKYFHSKSFRSKTIRPRFFFTKIYQAMFLSCVLILSPVVLFSVQTIEACAQAVSYTHLDVYKRQEVLSFRNGP